MARPITPRALTRARLLLTESADVLALRARKELRRQLTAVSSSDSPRRRRAYQVGRQAARRGINTLTRRQVGWVATLWRARWLADNRYEITGWAYERGYGYPTPPRFRVFLRRPGSRLRVQAQVRTVSEMEINGFATRAEFDYANTGFVATFDLAPLVADPSPEKWQVHVEVTGADGRTRSGTLKYRHRRGSARVLGAGTDASGVQLVPSWRRRQGLFFARKVPTALATGLRLDRRHVQLDVSLRGLAPVRAELVSRQARRPLRMERTAAGTVRLDADVPETWVVTQAAEELEAETEESALDRGRRLGDESEDAIEEVGSEQGGDERSAATVQERLGQQLVAQTYRVVLTDADGSEHRVATALGQGDPVQSTGSGLMAYAGGGGLLYLSDTSSRLVVTEVRLEPGEAPRLELGGTWGGTLDAVEMTLRGRRQELPAQAVLHPDGTWTASLELLRSQWGGPEQLPRTGTYTLRATDPAGGSVRMMSSPAVVARTPEKLDVPQARMRLEIGKGRALVLRVGLTRGEHELGSFHQRRMDRAYLEGEHAPQRSVYLESFYGRLATCNPYAIDRVLARDHPDWTRYWGVADISVPVPPGAVAVVEGTQAWFDARARSRYVVVNDWLRRRFVPQPFQTVLQTWHGSMFKRIGLDRPNVGASTRQALETERDKWDVLLSQNAHSTEILRSAYGWTGTFYEEGYPRNDALVQGSGEAVRAALGIRPEQRAVLYAPTWRDNAAGLVVFLDLHRLTEELGDDYVVLLRGHSRTVGHGASVRQAGVIDVTTYPSITELFLAADAMITDYSSVMFDFSVTRRPMIFYVPDLDAYRDDIRGVYFDLEEHAPGPVVATQEQVVAAIRAMDDPAPYAGRYARWVERFNTLDDGHSADRVVARLLEGLESTDGP
ncbi:CDP-glycerol glycerophosphotransferase family protein [Serinicoccus sp. LYQ131]|uniref:CDP-glycerol glycerophosphotransferase family protein n=1 Tax=Serinicoccus sp. LYQ131 TaxID=3378797 RepID=UPI00385247EB